MLKNLALGFLPYIVVVNDLENFNNYSKHFIVNGDHRLSGNKIPMQKIQYLWFLKLN